jgi:hypothetical protein
VITLSNKIGIVMSTSPTLAQWQVSTPCKSFKISYTNKKKLKRGSLQRYGIHARLFHGILAAWTLKVGSFCLVMHSRLEGLPMDERTLDGYWKARVLEIRIAKIKNADTAVCDYYLFISGRLIIC